LSHAGHPLAVLTRDVHIEAVTLDDLINKTIALARENGYSLQQLRERVRERLLLEAPDHLLVVEQDEGLRDLMREELRLAREVHRRWMHARGTSS
jgi:hypothetical protein